MKVLVCILCYNLEAEVLEFVLGFDIKSVNVREVVSFQVDWRHLLWNLACGWERIVNEIECKLLHP